MTSLKDLVQIVPSQDNISLSMLGIVLQAMSKLSFEVVFPSMQHSSRVAISFLVSFDFTPTTVPAIGSTKLMVSSKDLVQTGEFHVKVSPPVVVIVPQDISKSAFEVVNPSIQHSSWVA